MPWEVSGIVEKRKQFLADYESGEWTMTDLCRAYEITRPTGYAVLRRYTRAGEAGLEEQSRAPKRHPNQTPTAIEEKVLALRRKHPRWGPRTLKELLERQNQRIAWPAASTIGEILDREGLTFRRFTRCWVSPSRSSISPMVLAAGHAIRWFCLSSSSFNVRGPQRGCLRRNASTFSSIAVGVWLGCLFGARLCSSSPASPARV